MANDLLSAAEARKRLDELRSTPAPQAPAMFRQAQPGGAMFVPSTGPSMQEWSPGKYLGGAVESLRGAPGEIVRGAGNLVGSFFKALTGVSQPRVRPPTRADVGAAGEAAGEFATKFGDIGTFASGGLMGDIGMPTQAPATGPWGAAGTTVKGIGGPASAATAPGLWRGLGTAPRVTDVPPTPRALPPPQVGVAGQPATPTGAGMMPPGPTATTRMPGGIPGAPEPPVRAPGPAFGQTPAEIAGGLAGRDLPPRAPGTEGRPPRAGQPTPPPLIPHGAERGRPSILADALINNNAADVDKRLSNRFRRALQPGMRARDIQHLDTQDQQLTTTADSIIAAKDHIQFRDPADPTGKALLPAGRLPRSLHEVGQAIDYLKGEIFKTYDSLVQRVGGQGVRIELAPVVAKLREFAANPENLHLPSIRAEALKLADEYAMQGSYTPSQAQNVMQSLNAQLHGFLQRGTASEAIFSHPTLMNDVRDTLLNTLNSTMERALGDPRYQTLRLRYGSLSAVEANLNNAIGRQVSTLPGFIERGFRQGELTGFLHGAVHFDVHTLGWALASRASRELIRVINSPNYAVTQMFKHRSAALDPYSFTRALSAQTAQRIGDFRQSAYDRAVAAPSYVGPSGL